MMKNLNVSPLEWDTDFFGISCGRLVIDAPEVDLRGLLEQLDTYQFVTIQNVGNKVGINKTIAENTQAFLVDINIQFEKDVMRGFSGYTEKHENIAVIKAKDTDKQIHDKLLVEREDFVFSKFVCDDKLDVRNGYLVYKEWLKNSRNYDNKYFALYYDGNEIGGYILFSIYDGEGTIELVKVNREYKGKGIATEMIRTVENCLKDKGIATVKVGTQLNNIPAINLYHYLGFREISRTSVYHLWNLNV